MNKLENLSSAVDGELDEQEMAFLLKDMNESDRERFDNYTLVGDLLRSNDLGHFHSARLMKQISAVIDEEPTVLAPSLGKRQALRLGSIWNARWVASAAAVGIFSFAINQYVPPLDTEVQMVKTNQATQISDREVALWQEYFMAHQQNLLRGGLAGVSPIVRADASQPNIATTERVRMDQSQPSGWMNVWGGDSVNSQSRVQYQYVSAGR